MATIGEVGDGLNRALNKIEQAISVANTAADLAEEAHELLGAVGEGSLQADVEETRAIFTKAVDGIREPEGLTSGLGSAADAIKSLVHRLQLNGGSPKAGTPTPPSPTPSLSPTSSSAPKPGSPEHVQKLRDQLPSPVEASTGQKTHGRWFADGVADTEIVSGQGADAADVAEALKSLQLPRPGLPFSAWHVETKLAVHMRNNDIQHATVLINNVPCPGDFGCEVLVGAILPAGSTLTIYGSDGYKQTISGGTRAPWQR